MPHRKAYRWLNQHPFLTVLIIVVLVAGPGYYRLESIARCGQQYAVEDSEAATARGAATERRDHAEDEAWDAVRAILSQEADQADFDRLRVAVRERDRLSDELKEEREDNPIPDPPSTFC